MIQLGKIFEGVLRQAIERTRADLEIAHGMTPGELAAKYRELELVEDRRITVGAINLAVMESGEVAVIVDGSWQLYRPIAAERLLRALAGVGETPEQHR